MAGVEIDSGLFRFFPILQPFGKAKISLLSFFAVKIWISKNSEVPVHEQLVAQITLGIASGDYAIGQRLPSTREIARRCGLHANTVSAAYQRLADEHLLEFRKGSGFYVAESASEQIETSRRLDNLVNKLLDDARDLGFGPDAIVQRIKDRQTVQTADRALLIEPDPGLRAILLHELASVYPRITGVGFDDFDPTRYRSNWLLTAMFDEKPRIDAVLRDGQQCLYLKGRSVASSMSGESRPGPGEMVAVVSGWDGFLNFARIVLLAADLDPGRLVVRSTADEDWESAIRTSSILICDSLTAHRLNGRPGVRAFRVISDESLSEFAALLPAPALS